MGQAKRRSIGSEPTPDQIAILENDVTILKDEIHRHVKNRALLCFTTQDPIEAPYEVRAMLIKNADGTVLWTDFPPMVTQEGLVVDLGRSEPKANGFLQDAILRSIQSSRECLANLEVANAGKKPKGPLIDKAILHLDQCDANGENLWVTAWKLDAERLPNGVRLGFYSLSPKAMKLLGSWMPDGQYLQGGNYRVDPISNNALWESIFDMVAKPST